MKKSISIIHWRNAVFFHYDVDIDDEEIYLNEIRGKLWYWWLLPQYSRRRRIPSALLPSACVARSWLMAESWRRLIVETATAGRNDSIEEEEMPEEHPSVRLWLLATWLLVLADYWRLAILRPIAMLMTPGCLLNTYVNAMKILKNIFNGNEEKW